MVEWLRRRDAMVILLDVTNCSDARITRGRTLAFATGGGQAKMFLAGDRPEYREKRIRDFLQREPAIAVILAAGGKWGEVAN
jgi:hypothetical protein